MAKKDMLLSELPINIVAVIVGVDGNSALKIRLMELGFVEGTLVKILNISPYKNSFLIEIRGSCLALRKSAVSLIRVTAL